MAIPGGAEQVGAAYVKITADGDGIHAEIVDQLEAADKDVEKAGERHGEKYGDGFERDSRIAERIGRRLRNARKEAVREGSLLGRLFGKAFGEGSRNDFLNFIGKRVGLVARIVGGLSGALGGFLESGSGFAGTFTRMATTLLSVGAAMIAVSYVVGVLAAAISGLTAILVAVAGTITFAVLGSLAALGGVLTVLIGGIGILTAGIMSLDGALKSSLKRAIDPYVDRLKALGKLAAQNIFEGIPEELDRLDKNFGRLRPIVLGVSEALHDVVLSFIALGESPAVARFLREMKEFLPDAVRQLGDIFADTFRGLLGVFRAAIPVTRRFLNYLEGAAQSFGDFANTRGQKELREFFNDAGDAAASFFDLLGSITGLLFDLFEGVNGGAKQGNRIFDSLTANVDKLRDFLDTPQGQSALKEWLRDGVDLAQTIGDLIVGFGKMIAALDTDEAQRHLEGLLNAFTTLFDFIADHEGALKFLGLTLFGLGTASFFISTTTTILTAFGRMFTGIVAQANLSAAGVGAAMTRLTASMKIAAGIGGVVGLGLAMKDAKDEGASLGNVLAGAGSGALAGAMIGSVVPAVGTLAGALIGGGVGAVGAGLAGAFHESGEAAEDQAAQLEIARQAAQRYAQIIDALASSLDQTTGSFTKMSREIAFKSLFDDEGNLQAWVKRLQEGGASLREITLAMTDNKRAEELVMAARMRNADQLHSLILDKIDLQNQLDALAAQPGNDAERIALQEKIDLIDEQRRALLALDVEARKQLNAGDRAVTNWRRLREATASAIEILGIARKEFKSFPKEVRSKLRVDGVPKGIKETKDLARELGGLGRKVWKVILEARGIEPTKAKLDELVKVGRDKGGQTGTEYSNRFATSLHEGKTAWVRQVSEGVNATESQNKEKAKTAGDHLGEALVQAMAHQIDLGQGLVNAAVDRILANARTRANIIANSGPSGGGGGDGSFLPGGRTPDNPRISTTTGRTVNVGGMTVVSASDDAEAVASEVVNRLVALSY